MEKFNVIFKNKIHYGCTESQSLNFKYISSVRNDNKISSWHVPSFVHSKSYISGERLVLHRHAGILYNKWLCPNSQVEYIYTVIIANIFSLIMRKLIALKYPE